MRRPDGFTIFWGSFSVFVCIISLLAVIPGPPSTETAVLHPTVRVKCGDHWGSGVIIDDSHVLTAYHVVASHNTLGDIIQVDVFSWNNGDIDETLTLDALLIHEAEAEDLALLLILDPPDNLPVATLLPEAYDHKIQRFTPVTRSGCPFAEQPCHTRGEVADVHALLKEPTGPLLLATSPSIMGDSGGPLFAQIDGTWYVIGITSRIGTAGLTYVSHFSLYVPWYCIRPFLNP